MRRIARLTPGVERENSTQEHGPCKCDVLLLRELHTLSESLRAAYVVLVASLCCCIRLASMSHELGDEKERPNITQVTGADCSCMHLVDSGA